MPRKPARLPGGEVFLEFGLKRSEEQMLFGDAKGVCMTVADSSDDLIFIADWKRTILYVNPSACGKTGYTAKDLVGARMPMLYRKENESRYTAKIFKDLYETGCSRGELELMKKDGSTFHTMTTVIAYRDKSGDPVGTLSIAKDLTPGHLAVQRAMEEDSLLYEIIESMEDAVCVCDGDGRIQFVNSAHCRMLGYSKEELLGAKPPYPWVDPSCCGNGSIGFKRLQKEGMLRNFFQTWKTRANVKLNVSVAMAHLHNVSAKKLGHVCTIRDVTDVRYADELRQAKEQMQRLVFDVKQKAVRLQTLEETILMVLKNTTPAQVFKKITSSVKQLVQHDLAGFYVFDRSLRALVPQALSKQTPFSRKLGKFPLQLGEGIIGKAAVSGKLVWVNNAHLDPRSKYPPGMKPEKEHFIAVPLKGRRSIFGVLVVSRNRDPEFIEEEALVVKSFADAATVALENASLFQELSGR